MSAIDITRLIALAAIWGASFMFIRVAAPELGTVLTAIIRVGLAGVALTAYLRLTGRSLEWRAHWREYLATGALNSAVPFMLFAYAAQTLPASYSVVMNATSPLFGILLAAVWLGRQPTRTALLGVAVGFAGVALIARLGPVTFDGAVVLAIFACLGASFFYAVAALYVQRYVRQRDSHVTATASQIAAGIVLLPLVPFAAPPGNATAAVIGSMIALALLCSGVGYLLYFKLIETVGPTRALTVTFLQPAFGIVWGALFLGELITPLMVAGCMLVIAGTALALRGARSASADRIHGIHRIPRIRG